MPKFENDAKPMTPDRAYRSSEFGFYGYTAPSKYLFQWSRFLQALISQAGTWMLFKRFHDNEYAIRKTEGGCRIDGRGDLVLSHEGCYWDYGSNKDNTAQKMADLITAIVLAFDPMDPVDSMVNPAAKLIEVEPEALKTKVMNSRGGGVFGGDALCDFFRWNPFSRPPIDEEYNRWSAVEFLKSHTDEQMDQIFADKNLGEDLLKRINETSRKAGGKFGFGITALCCNPNRGKDGLRFWVNTGCQTQVDGWKTQDELEKYIASGEKLEDERKSRRR